jgi:hypothetical protein
VYSTFLCGSGGHRSNSIALDPTGLAYVTGYTSSPDFPTTEGALQTTFGGERDVFFTKLNADGSNLSYSTFLGGSGSDYGYGIAVDDSGAAYITGYTYSIDFPTTLGAFGSTFNDLLDIFVAKFSNDTKPDLSITEINPIQVVGQPDINGDGKWDYVLGKPMVVRVYVNIIYPEKIAPEDQEAVRVTLQFQGAEISLYKSITELLAGPVDFFLTPGDFGDSTIVVNVDTDNQIIESNENNNSNENNPLWITVKDTRELHILNMPIGGYGEANEFDESVTNNGKFIKGMYPIAANEFINEKSDSPIILAPDNYLSNISATGFSIAQADLLYIAAQGKLISPFADRYVGVANSQLFTSRYGEASGGISICRLDPIGRYMCTIAVIISQEIWVATAHELGHTYGLLDNYTDRSSGGVGYKVPKIIIS